MPDFNPQVPRGYDYDPNYTHMSRAIPQPEADKSGEYSAKTLGQGIEGLTGVVDTGYKNTIESKIYDAVDQERGQYTEALEGYQAGQNLTLLAQKSDVNPPQSLQKGLDQASSLKNGQINNDGKITETYYVGRLNDLAKQLRTQYPGYRDYIDQEMSKITGMNPANAYIQHMIQDINAQAAGQKTDREKYLSAALELVKSGALDKQGNPLGAPIANYIRNGGDLDRAAYMLSLANSSDWKKRQILDDLNLKKNLTEDDKVTVRQNLTDSVHNTATNIWNAALIGNGGSMGSISKLLQDQQTGKSPPLEEKDWLQMGSAIQAARQAAFNQEWHDAHVKGASGRSVAMTLGDKELRDGINDGLTVYDEMLKSIGAKDLTRLGLAQAYVKALQDDRTKSIMENSDFGSIMGTYDIIRQKMGDAFASQMMQEGVKNMGSAIGPFINEQKQKMLLDQTNQPNTPKPFKQIIQDVKKYNIPVASTSREFIKSIDTLTSKDTPEEAKIKLAYSFFGQNNQGALAEFQKGESQGYVFNTLTAKGVTDEIARLGKIHPEIMKMYKDWAEGEFSQQMFSTELKDLNNFTNDKHFIVQYDPKNTRWDLFDSKGVPLSGDKRMSFTPQERNAVYTFNRLNSGMYNLAQIAKSNGEDPNTFVMGLMSKYADLSGESDKSSPGLVSQLFHSTIDKISGAASAVGKSLTYTPSKEELHAPTQPLQFSNDTNKGPTVQEFTQNPAGRTSSKRPPKATEKAAGALKSSGGSETPENVHPANSMNLIDTMKDIFGVTVDDIPDGMSPAEFIRQNYNVQRK